MQEEADTGRLAGNCSLDLRGVYGTWHVLSAQRWRHVGGTWCQTLLVSEMLATLTSGCLTLGYSFTSSRGAVLKPHAHAERGVPVMLVDGAASEQLFHARGQPLDSPFMLQANLIEAPETVATATQPAPGTIEQQLADLQQAIQLAKIKIELAESQYSSLESLSKQLENAQRDAADNIAAVRASIDGATLPSAAAITEEVEKSVDAAYARADAARAAVVQAPADAVVQAPADVVVQAASEAVQAASEAVPVDAVDAAADAVQNLGGDAVAQAAQVAADAAPDATPIILVAAFLQVNCPSNHLCGPIARPERSPPSAPPLARSSLTCNTWS